MTGAPRATACVALVAAWAIAAAPLPVVVRAIAGFLAVFIAPGALFDAVMGGASRERFAFPARALAFSLGILGVLGFLCSKAALSVVAVNTALFGTSALLALLVPAGAPTVRSSKAAADSASLGRGVLVAIAILVVAAAGLAAIDLNIARDRMWYAAYVTRLASGAPVDWHDPVLGTGRVVWRFAHNAWLTALGGWSMLADAPAPWLIERCAPPLLVALVPSASYSLGYALFRNRDRALVTALCGLVVVLASNYPYFAPERTPLFARIVEDKTAALVLLAPVAIGLALTALTVRETLSRADCVRLGLAAVGVALSHGIVYLIVCVSLAAFAAERVFTGQTRLRRAAVVLGFVGLIALAPAALGIAARADALRPGTEAVLQDAPQRDPVVRAHLRMERLRGLPIGGPIVEPRLLADPLLLTALAGLGVAAAARGTIWGAYACTTTVAFLVLAFLPFVAPAFGRAVVPWMAYRALWGIPFSVLLAGIAVQAAAFLRPRVTGQRAARANSAVIVIVALIGLAALPWERFRASGERLSPDEGTRRLLAAVAELPPNAKVAAAPGLAELIPAYTGKAVLAFADRGTAAIATVRRDAERRLRANAAVVALHGHVLTERRALMAAHDVSHVVFEHAACEPGTHAVYADERFSVCRVETLRAAAEHSRDDSAADARGETSKGVAPAHRSGAAPADAHWTPAKDYAPSAVSGRTVASLASTMSCEPAPTFGDGLYRWRRAGRWSGEFTAVSCAAKLPAPVTLLGLRLRAHLPRAREALVYDASVSGPAGACAARSGAVEVAGDDWADIPMPCAQADEVRIRFAPAYLPYLNLTALEARAAELSGGVPTHPRAGTASGVSVVTATNLDERH